MTGCTRNRSYAPPSGWVVHEVQGERRPHRWSGNRTGRATRRIPPGPIHVGVRVRRGDLRRGPWHCWRGLLHRRPCISIFRGPCGGKIKCGPERGALRCSPLQSPAPRALQENVIDLAWSGKRWVNSLSLGSRDRNGDTVSPVQTDKWCGR